MCGVAEWTPPSQPSAAQRIAVISPYGSEAKRKGWLRHACLTNRLASKPLAAPPAAPLRQPLQINVSQRMVQVKFSNNFSQDGVSAVVRTYARMYVRTSTALASPFAHKKKANRQEQQLPLTPPPSQLKRKPWGEQSAQSGARFPPHPTVGPNSAS